MKYPSNWISFLRFTVAAIFFLEKEKVGLNMKYSFCRQVDRDCEFLEQERIMDYSLLVGLHFRETSLLRDPSNEGRASSVKTPMGSFLSRSVLVFLVLN